MNAPKQGAPGRIKEIDSPSNPLIKEVRALEKKRGRADTNSFFVEGHKLLIDALDNDWTIRTLIVAKSAIDEKRVADLVGQCTARSIDTLLVSKRILTALAHRDNPQMVCAVVERQFGSPNQLLRTDHGTWVALDRVRDPGNLGTIVRTADALGANGIILLGYTTDPFATEAVRATMGSIFTLPIIAMAEDDFLAMKPGFSGRIVGTHLAGSVDFRKPNFKECPTILIMGNEQAGLSPALVDACDQLIRIPQAGSADSLNLAIATGICLFQAQEHLLPSINGERA